MRIWKVCKRCLTSAQYYSEEVNCGACGKNALTPCPLIPKNE